MLTKSASRPGVLELVPATSRRQRRVERRSKVESKSRRHPLFGGIGTAAGAHQAFIRLERTFYLAKEEVYEPRMAVTTSTLPFCLFHLAKEEAYESEMTVTTSRLEVHPAY